MFACPPTSGTARRAARWLLGNIYHVEGYMARRTLQRLSWADGANPRAAATSCSGSLERVRTLLNTCSSRTTRAPRRTAFAGGLAGQAPLQPIAARLRRCETTCEAQSRNRSLRRAASGAGSILLDFRPSPGPDGLRWRHDGSRAAGLLASVMDADRRWHLARA